MDPISILFGVCGVLILALIWTNWNVIQTLRGMQREADTVGATHVAALAAHAHPMPEHLHPVAEHPHDLIDHTHPHLEHIHPLSEQETKFRQHYGAHVPRMKGVVTQNIAGEIWRTTQCVECGALELHEVST